jgi:hypothetical protein
MKQVSKALDIAQQELCKSHLRIYKHKETKYHMKILMKGLNHKQFNKH